MRTKLNTETNILKYYEALKKLNDVLKFTEKISIIEFARKQKLSKSFGLALQKGGIIKKFGKGAGSTYKWSSIPPTREMAVKTIQELSKLASSRQKPETKKEPVSVLRKTLSRYEMKLFFGLIKLIIRPIYN